MLNVSFLHKNLILKSFSLVSVLERLALVLKGIGVTETKFNFLKINLGFKKINY